MRIRLVEILRREGQNHVEPVLSRSQAIAVADDHHHINRAQKSAVEDVLSSSDHIQGIQGFAGSGKTTTLAVIRPGVSVYQEIERELSVGDRIQFTAPDKSLGVANRDMAAIEAIHPDGRLSIRLDNNRQIEFNPNEHRHLYHGYAVTSHSAQGLTAERVLVHADTSVHPDLLNSRFGYVSISRASHEATLFTDDLAKLGPQLGAEVSKTSALEINQTSSIAQGIGTRL